MTETVLVVGALGGIGRAVVSRQAAENKNLLLADAPFASGMAQLSEQAELDGARSVHSLRADVTCGSGVQDLVQWAEEHATALGGFVYAAGLSGPVCDFREYPTEELDTVMRVNVSAPFMLLQQLAPLLEQGAGSSVLVGSTSSVRGRRHLSGYVASKHALLGLVRSVTLDLSQSHQRVNAVLPGPVRTPMLDELERQVDEAAQAGFGRAAEVPPASPQSVADLIAFLLSPQTQHIRGQGVVIDGGTTVG